MTSNGGLILVRELDERLGFGELIQQHLASSGEEHTVPLADLLRQSVYSRLAGYEDVNDAEHSPEIRRSADRFREELGSRGSPAIPVANLRDGVAG